MYQYEGLVPYLVLMMAAQRMSQVEVGCLLSCAHQLDLRGVLLSSYFVGVYLHPRNT